MPGVRGRGRLAFGCFFSWEWRGVFGGCERWKGLVRREICRHLSKKDDSYRRDVEMMGKKGIIKMRIIDKGEI